MVPSELMKVAKYICSIHSNMDYEAYSQQLNIIYGSIESVHLSKEAVLNEIIEIEQERIASANTSIDSRINNAFVLCLEYSKISFLLAQRSLENNRSYYVAALLQNALEGLLESGTISNQDKEEIKVLISETNLDFEFAKGNHNVSSLRMAQIIREHKRNGGN